MSLAEAISAIEHIKTTWVSVKLKLVPRQETFLYTACKKCGKALVADLEWLVVCPSCKETTTIQLRCNIGFYLSDEAATITASIFTSNAEELIPFTPLEIKAAEENGSLIIPEMKAAPNNKKVAKSMAKQTPTKKNRWARSFADSQADQVNLPFENPSSLTNSASMGKVAQASASAESPIKKRKSKLKKN